jgi:hypothetical protein
VTGKTLAVYHEPLTVMDRCDRDGAQSLLAVLVKANGLRLDFCQHHARKHAAAIKQQTDIILDDRKTW